MLISLLRAARTFAALLILIGFGYSATAQTVSVGAGSYRLGVPSGEVGPQNASGQNVTPKVSPSFSQKAQTNDYWSSLMYSFFGDTHSNILYAHPLNAKAVARGLEIGYTTQHVFAANDVLYPYVPQMTVGVDGLNANRTTTDSYGDWTVTARWQQGAKAMTATLGHGLPFVFFEVEGDDAVITTASTPTIWSQDGPVLGMTIEGRHYGVFAPAGATWSGTGTLTSDLAGEGYLSVALLPDAETATLELFRQHAYAFVTGSTVAWDYDEATATVVNTYSYQTELKGSDMTTVDETLTALYRHQWLNVREPLTDYTYESPRGEMKLRQGSTFSTALRFTGVLPTMPDQGDYNRDDLLAFVQQAASESLTVEPTYENGKSMARFTNLVHLAEYLGATTERDHFLAEIKTRLEDWFTAGGAQQYAYIDSWDVLTGYPSGFGADNQVNDHHFHTSYAIQSAATVAQYDSAWASQENWGGMVNLLVRDANSPDRDDPLFPFLRSFDAYAGHSWAAGHGDFAEGNNQESSSESLNFASAVVLWGEATGQAEMRDLGVYLYATEVSAVHQYWFDVDDEIFPEDYPHVAIGMVWGGKNVHSTWFGADPEFIHGINILPVTSASLYLGHHPDYVVRNYDEIVAENNGQPDIWQDLLWQYLALADPDRALSAYLADPNYPPFDGESRAHTMHWLYVMKKMGRVDTTITADTPTYAVFRDDAGERTYAAYNAGSTARTVRFSDGYELSVPSRQMAWESTADEDPNAPVALLVASDTRGKAPMTVDFQASRSFDRAGGDLTFAWSFGDSGTSSQADTSFTFTEVGEVWARLAVTNTLGITTRDSVLITVLGNGTPYSGTAITVPGTVQAENYDVGGEGVAYHDVDANNIGLAFRPSEGVDLEGIPGGFAVYWIVAGEWLEYTIDVPESGVYRVDAYAATVPGFGKLRILVDNRDVSGWLDVRGTGSFINFEPEASSNFQMDAGTHILRIEADSDSDKKGWLFSLDRMQVTKVTGASVDDPVALTTSLGTSYPNPVAHAAHIPYSLAQAGPVELAVFDLVGRRVALLRDGVQEAGEHAAPFDASALPSGVYVVRLTTTGHTATQRVLVVR